MGEQHVSERHVGEQHASGQHTYRVIVRGTWEGLTEGARARLLGEAGEHGMASMRFTEDGSLSYEPSPLKHFSMRYVVVSDAADGEEMAGAIAEDRAERRCARSVTGSAISGRR